MSASLEEGSKRRYSNPFSSLQKKGFEEERLLLKPDASRLPWWNNRATVKLRWFASLAMKHITWSRVKVLVVLMILIFTLFLFSTHVEDGEKLNLGATSQTRPMIVPITDSSPIELLEVFLQVQPQPYKSNETWVVVGLEKRTGPTLWITYDYLEVTLSLNEDTLQRHIFEVMEEEPYSDWRFNVSTNSLNPLGITFEVNFLPAIARFQVVLAGLILIGVYVLIVFELVHRTIAALFGSFVALAIYAELHSRPTLAEVVSWIDFDTTGLLFGMMVIVGLFSQTGFFEWVAVKAYKYSKGKLWNLVTILCIFTALVSAFLDNVTTILLLTPVTIKLCKVLEIPPQQVLITLVMYSNLGGAATAVGDPPNIIISTNPVLARNGVTFASFTLHMTPGILLCILTCYLLIKRLSKSSLKREPNLMKKTEIEIWRKTARKLRDDIDQERVVKQKLQEYVEGLEQAIIDAPTVPDPIDMAAMEAKYPIRDKVLFLNSCIIIAVVILLFFLHSFVQLELSLAWIAIIGAMALLLLSGVKDIDDILEKVEFSTLLFFAGLFILMKVLEEMGLMDFVGRQTSFAISRVSEGQPRLAAAVVLILWVSAIVSAFIDNIPFTAAMVPVIAKLGDGELGLPLTPLVWALAFGTCLGGNGTLIGASANVVAAGISEAEGYPIRFNTFFRTGFPVLLCSVSTATVYLLFFHVLIPWY